MLLQRLGADRGRLGGEMNNGGGIAQARALREQSAKGGLRFEAHLPPGLADWLLEQIEHGVFADPSASIEAPS